MKRWWLTSTDVFFKRPQSANIAVRYAGVSADGFWHFELTGDIAVTKAEPFRVAPAVYNPAADSWTNFESFPPFGAENLETLRAIATRRAAPRVLESQQRLLDELVTGSLGQPGGILTGKRLRSLTNAADTGELVKMLDTLIPRCVEWGADTFQPTFEGLLMSSMRERVIAVVDAVLMVLRARFRADPDVDSFALSDLRSFGVREDEKALAEAVVYTAQLARGVTTGGWGAPDDIEQLVSRAPDFATFRAYCRDFQMGVPARSWDHAPAKLSEELSQDPPREWWSPIEALPDARQGASPLHVFYSWQSDRPNATNRGLIQDALERALRDLKRDPAVEHELILERDTEGDPGAPHIAETILKKVDRATLFVADVSFIADTSKIGDEAGRPTPNPNVMIELGYAMAKLGSDRIVLVFNDAFGRVEDLPFDLRYRRVLKYTSRHDDSDRATPRQRLQRVFEEAIRNHIGGVNVR